MLPGISYFDGATFTSTNPWVFIPDPVNYNIVYSEKIATIPCYTTNNYVGPFFYNEGFQLDLSLPYNISYIRFRATVIKFGSWADYTTVQILLDNI
jgi:hypothetical protein